MKQKNKLKVGFTAVTTVSVILTALVFIGLILEFLDGDLALILAGVFGTIAVASAFSFNAVALAEKGNKIIAIISGCLIWLSAILFELFFIGVIDSGTILLKVAGTLAVFSVMFTIVVSMALKLKKSLTWMQITTFSLMAIIDVMLSLQIFGLDVIQETIGIIFAIACVITIALLFVMGAIAKKKIYDVVEDGSANGENVTISKEEYEELKQEIKRLKERYGEE